MARIRINGVDIVGGDIIINRNRVVIDGVDVTPDAKEINIEVTGDVAQLKVDACETVSVKGNVAALSTLSGDVAINGDVTGSVSTMSGDVDCDGSIGGSVSTLSGNVKHREKR